MKMGHEAIMAGHQGIDRTHERVRAQFYWKGMYGDIAEFCKSCPICQKTTPKGSVPGATLGKMPLIDEPWRRIAMDLVGGTSRVRQWSPIHTDHHGLCDALSRGSGLKEHRHRDSSRHVS